jgi:hypothetical protein
MESLIELLMVENFVWGHSLDSDDEQSLLAAFLFH